MWIPSARLRAVIWMSAREGVSFPAKDAGRIRTIGFLVDSLQRKSASHSREVAETAYLDMEPAELIERRHSPLKEPRIVLQGEQERHKVVLVRTHVGAREQAEEDDDRIADLGIVERREELFGAWSSGGGGGVGGEEVAEGFIEVVVAAKRTGELLLRPRESEGGPAHMSFAKPARSSRGRRLSTLARDLAADSGGAGISLST